MKVGQKCWCNSGNIQILEIKFCDCLSSRWYNHDPDCVSCYWEEFSSIPSCIFLSQFVLSLRIKKDIVYVSIQPLFMVLHPCVILYIIQSWLFVFVFQFYRELGHQAGMQSERQTRVTACLGIERLSVMCKFPQIWFKLEKLCYHRPRRLHIVFFIFLCVKERKVAVEIPSNCRTSNHKDSFTSLHEHSFTCFLKDKFISR